MWINVSCWVFEGTHSFPHTAVTLQPSRLGLDPVGASQVFRIQGIEALWEEESGAKRLKPKHCESTLHPFCLLPCVPPFFHLSLPLSLLPVRVLLSLLSMCLSHPLHHSPSSILSIFNPALLCIWVSPPPPCPLPLWMGWAAENTEPEDKMSGSQLPWKAMGRPHACIRPYDWPVWLCVSVCVLCVYLWAFG